MSNMSYCRFENTLHDLQDCYNYLHTPLDPNEHGGYSNEYHSRERLIQLCQEILEEVGMTVEGKAEIHEYEDEDNS